MKKHYLSILGTAMALAILCGCNHPKQTSPLPTAPAEQATVVMVRDITPESLVRIYNHFGIQTPGRVAVKISTGESGKSNYLRPELIGDLVHLVNGTIVECNCAYWGNRDNNDEHWKAIQEHGFLDIADVDIMDSEGEMRIPVRDSTHIPYDIVGNHLAHYDYMICLSHFKGHPMAGYGGAIKNMAIGVASANGKLLIHTAGRKADADHKLSGWSSAVVSTPQDDFLESMAAAAQAVADYMKGRVLYINVMNNLSVDCDCVANPKEPQMKDVGILASTDPVALDQACLDLVFKSPVTEDNNPEPLKKRINKKHGRHTVDYAAQIGLGTKNYTLEVLD